MCGIAGFVDFNSISSMSNLRSMTDALTHRGPDSSGYEIYDNNNSRIGLGHRRLAIIDLSPLGKQPMSKHSLHITYNGEIYNYQEIKKDLTNFGYNFVSNSDTEVILSAIDKWGTHEALNRFNGMFSFVVYDQPNSKVIFARDRSGIKPFYIYKVNDLTLFGSELKALHKHPNFKAEINKDAIPSMLQYKYVPSTQCIYNDVSKLKPGYYYDLDLSTKELTEHKYWDVFDYYNKPKLNITLSEAVTELDSLLKSACNYRMVSDVPVGIFLSGGYDSSLVSAVLQRDSNSKIKTFTIGFENQKFNEAKYAKMVAEHIGSDHYEYYCKEKQAQEILTSLPYFYDEPFADASAIPTMLVSKMAAKEVTVVLSADAGDEVFGGYSKYLRTIKNYNLANGLPKIFRSSLAFKYLSKALMNQNLSKSLLALSNFYNTKSSHASMMSVGSQSLYNSELQSLISYRYNSIPTLFETDHLLNDHNDSVNKMLAIDYKTYLTDDIMTKVDRATMSASIEGREPLLDYRLIEFASTLNSDFKINNNEKKYLLKKVTHNYIPKKIMDRPKMGFSVPYFEWLRGDLRYLIEDYLSDKRIKTQGLFNYKFINKKKTQFLKGYNFNNDFIWAMLSFQMWYDQWH